MSDDVKNLFRIMGGFALGALLMMAYYYDNPPQYTIDWRDEGKIISANVRSGAFYTIKTDKGEFSSIDLEAEKHLKRFTVGKTLYKLYVVKKLQWPGMKSESIGEIREQYGCKGCGYILEGQTLVAGAIKW